MAIVTISRGSYSRGRDVAQAVAQRLGYECIAREVVLEAARQFQIPEVQLAEAMEAAPWALDPLLEQKRRFVAAVGVTLLRHVRRDNVVYHGLAGHFFLRWVPHVVKVRVLADREDRIRIVMERDGKTWGDASQFLETVDEQRKAWGMALYGVDSSDPNLFDLTLNIRQLSLEGAVELVCRAVALPEFRTTPESLEILNDLILAGEVKIPLLALGVDLAVSARKGKVRVDAKAPRSRTAALEREIEELARAVPGVHDLQVTVFPLG